MIPGEEAARPIDDGQTSQVLVEFIGPHDGLGQWGAPVTSREYFFSADIGDRVKWVLTKDLDYFRARPHFRVHEDRTIAGPVASPDSPAVTPADPVSAIEPERKPPGRPRADEREMRIAWHLREHEGRKYGYIAHELSLEGANPVAAIRMRLARMKRQGEGFEPGQCEHCQDERLG